MGEMNTNLPTVGDGSNDATDTAVTDTKTLRPQQAGQINPRHPTHH